MEYLFTNNVLCQMLGIRIPILLGGMAYVGTSSLVAAVSNAGGLGLIGSGPMTTQELHKEIEKTRQLTNATFGVNLVVNSEQALEKADVISKANVSVVTISGPNAELLVKKLKGCGCIVIPVVASVSLAKRLEKKGADAIIAEGMESGGHIGRTTTMALVPQVADAVKIPVIAAGGIADTRGFLAALALGATGVQIGTRFIATTEANAHSNYKAAIIKANDRATVVTGDEQGAPPARCLSNGYTHEYETMKSNQATSDELLAFSRGRLKGAIVQGDIENGSIMAGQISGLIDSCPTVSTVFDDLINKIDFNIKRVINNIG